MKDIDFDELDKAVSSVLSQAGTTKAATAAPAVNDQPQPESADDVVVEAASEDKPTLVPEVNEPVATVEDEAVEESSPEAPEEAEVVTVATPEPEEAIAQKPAAAIIHPPRKAGRFMDVVHPSSDMAPAKGVPDTGAGRVSMAGRTLQPLTSDIVQPAPVEPSKTEVEPPETIEPVVTASQPPADTSVMTSAPQPAAQPDVPVTPFLSDAKVEKRPLGAFAETASEPTAPAAPEQVPADPVTAIQPTGEVLPPELNRDIVSVESDMEADEPTSTPSEAPIAPAAVTISGTLSIPKQYQQAERTTDTEAHSLFDTENYHPPLAVNGDHGHRFLWAWITVAVLLLAGTAGLFAFWYVQGL